MVPAVGGVAPAKLTWSGTCEFSKLLALPTAAVNATSSRLGADGSMLMAVLYSGTIDFGGGPLTSTGPNALAVAPFDGLGNLLWAKSFGSGNSSFTLGSLTANASGTAIFTGGYTGGVDLGGGQLSASDDTFLVSFDSNGQYRWGRTVTVGLSHRLVGTVGKCGVALDTNSTTVDLVQGPSYPSPGYSWLVVGAGSLRPPPVTAPLGERPASPPVFLPWTDVGCTSLLGAECRRWRHTHECVPGACSAWWRSVTESRRWAREMSSRTQCGNGIALTLAPRLRTSDSPALFSFLSYLR